MPRWEQRPARVTERRGPAGDSARVELKHDGSMEDEEEEEEERERRNSKTNSKMNRKRIEARVEDEEAEN